MNYLIAVLPDRIQAEEAYSALEREGLPMEKVSILGKGYKTADEYGLIDPKQQAQKQATLMSYWLVPFGFISGFVFNSLTGIELFNWAGSLGNHLIGGVFGAIAGAMGSYFIGGGVGLAFGSGDALPYRNRLKAGKYLVVVNGSPNITNQATRILKQFDPENIQGYVDPTS
ncbi:hypothetical protein H6F88_21240 [Oculatella sp. FACHB-28]|uniref:hypothetical protein n=1 Tax=Cyanophyceae TaxID=3028117 RepID=UPI001683C908|nr:MULTISPECIES: hypothetical protein [Cyanophyceae]MBD2058488.1 hypothetical protein [Oculatella sp. FACHB-28]MBD2071753.1 hypothetical protein [Leptolyngbya sp. FACHB-671]